MLERLICLLLCFSVPLDSYAKTIRQLQFNENQIPEINTAIGFSTILDFPSRPLSAVLGDQDAFKLEYVGNSITIKPLVPHAKSNLFVFTEFERFNCTLKTGNSTDVDYLVKIKVKDPPEKTDGGPFGISARPTQINRAKSQNGFSLKIITVTYPRNQSDPRSPLVVNFELANLKGRYNFAPGAIGVRQDGHFLKVESLYLDSFELDSKKPVKGTLVLLLKDLISKTSPLEIIFAALKNKKIFRLSVRLPAIRPVMKKEVSVVGKNGKN